MSVQGKEFGLLTGVAAGSLIAGGLLGYYLGKGKCHVKSKGGEMTDENEGKSFLIRDSPVMTYIVENSGREPEILKELREYTMANVDMAVMVTDPLQCQLFKILLKTLDAKKCIEVGVFTGYNVLNVALCLPAGGKVYGLDISERWVNHGRQFFKKANVEDKIDITIGPAADSLEKLINEGHAGTIDFIYIDADKESYNTYYEKSLVLLRPGGIIAFDNMLQAGHVAALDKITKPSRLSACVALDRLNKKLHKDERVEVSFLNIADGVYFAMKK